MKIIIHSLVENQIEENENFYLALKQYQENLFSIINEEILSLILKTIKIIKK